MSHHLSQEWLRVAMDETMKFTGSAAPVMLDPFQIIFSLTNCHINVINNPATHMRHPAPMFSGTRPCNHVHS